MKQMTISRLILVLLYAVIAVGCHPPKIPVPQVSADASIDEITENTSNGSDAKAAAWRDMRQPSHILNPEQLAYWRKELTAGNPEAIDRLCWHYVDVGDEGLCDEATQAAAYSDVAEGWWRHGLELFRCGKNESERLEGLFFITRAIPLVRNQVVIQEIWVSIATAFATGSFGIPKNHRLARYALAHQNPPITGEHVTRYFETAATVPPIAHQMPYCSRP